MTDTREKLEADVRSWWEDEFSRDFYTDDDLLNITTGWLDRQAAITRAECCEDCDIKRANERQARKIHDVCEGHAELQARLEKSHRDWLVDVGEYEQIADGMKKQIAELLEQVDELQSRLEAQERETACQSADYVAEQKRSIELQAQVESLENMASSYERRIEALEAERDELQAQADEKWNMYVATHEKADKLQAECEARGRALESNLKRIHELEANSMPLPLDADGVPIRVGDVMCSAGIREKGHKVIVSALFEDGFVEYGSVNGFIGPLNQEDWVHVKPRTVEDVLLDVIEHAICPSNSWDEIIAKYAAELRMVGE